MEAGAALAQAAARYPDAAGDLVHGGSLGARPLRLSATELGQAACTASG